MPYVKNPFGRIVEVDEEYYQDWLKSPGFMQPTPEEVKEFNAKRNAQIEAWKKDEERAREVHGKPGLYFVTVSQGGKDGYGIASKNIFKELINLGVDVSFSQEGQKISLVMHAPYSITRLESPIRILYTMFESDKIPDDWKDYLEQADELIVPSKWNAEVFEKAGFKAKVIPLGYDDEAYKFIPRTVKRDENKNFTFLHYNAFNIRKGFTEVFKAFTQEFQADEPVRMIFKTTLDRMPIPILSSQYPNIEVITGQVPEPEMQKILARSDAFVFPSRGEGFGMTPLEAMATGLPTIIPNAHGLTEYFNADYMYECKIGSTCPAIYSRYKNQDVGKMFVTDVADLQKQMRYIYEHQKEALEKGQKASEYVKNWTFKKTAVALKAIIDEMSAKPEMQKPLKNVLRLEQLRG